MIDESLITPIAKLSADMVKAMRQGGGGITDTEARYLVDLYYTMQRMRVRTNNQVKGLERDAKKEETKPEPHDGLDWTLTQFDALEHSVARLLGIYIELHPMRWFFDQTVGIGPILAAGLIAHININRAETAGHIWRFAGLDPTQTWDKGKKRPFNGTLKTLCWKIGESFVKVCNRPDAFYGRLYRERKTVEWNRNLSGELSEQAAANLARKNYGKTTDAYQWYSGNCSAEKAREMLEEDQTPTAAACSVEEGGIPMLPPAHIQMRAKRYAVKLFLAHLHQRWREHEGLPVPPPYVIAHKGHAHFIKPPQVLS